ncbi:hypothetical protein D3C76_1039370 [compost metagenome]
MASFRSSSHCCLYHSSSFPASLVRPRALRACPHRPCQVATSKPFESVSWVRTYSVSLLLNETTSTFFCCAASLRAVSITISVLPVPGHPVTSDVWFFSTLVTTVLCSSVSWSQSLLSKKMRLAQPRLPSISGVRNSTTRVKRASPKSEFPRVVFQ